MRILLFILLFPVFSYANRTNATVSGGNINNLTNAQSAYGLTNGDTLAIPITLTSYCAIGGIIGTDRNNPIVVVVNGLVTPFQFEIGNCINVKFYLKLSDSSCGMVITGAGRAMVSNGSKLQYCYFGGIAVNGATDYSVLMYHSRTFAGNLDSTNHNLIFDSIRLSNGAVNLDAFNFNNNGTSYLRGLWDSVEFRRCYVHDMPSGIVWSIQHFFHARWYRCTIIRTGYNDTRHAAVVDFGDGSGSMEETYCYNCYGDKMRFKAGTSLVVDKNQPMDTAKIINNKFVLSPKYGGIETNSDASTFDTSSQWIRPVNYIIANNNMGRFNDSDYVDSGVPLDIYKHYGFIWLQNLVAWDSHADKPAGANVYWHIGDGSPPPDDTTGCRYGTAAQVLVLYVQDTVQAVTKTNSIGNAIGKKLPTIVRQSFNGISRTFAVNYDIGAYQWTGRSFFAFRKNPGFKVKPVN